MPLKLCTGICIELASSLGEQVRLGLGDSSCDPSPQNDVAAWGGDYAEGEAAVGYEDDGSDELARCHLTMTEVTKLIALSTNKSTRCDLTYVILISTPAGKSMHVISRPAANSTHVSSRMDRCLLFLDWIRSGACLVGRIDTPAGTSGLGSRPPDLHVDDGTRRWIL